jgi:hypothetical protein
VVAQVRGQVGAAGLDQFWPTALGTAQQPFRSRTWIAALWVIVDRDGGDFARTRRLGAARFEHMVRGEITKRGGQKPPLRILRRLFASLADPTGVTAHRTGALERVQLLLEDWAHAHQRLADTEARTIGVLEQLELTGLATSITALSAIGAAAILAQTGDPTTLQHRPRPGQTRRPRAAGEAVRRLRWPHQADRPRTTRAASGRLARGLGSAASQSRLRRPLPAPDQPRTQQAPTNPGADRHRRGDLAAPARRDHHRPSLGPDHRHPRHTTTTAASRPGLTNCRGASS